MGKKHSKPNPPPSPAVPNTTSPLSINSPTNQAPVLTKNPVASMPDVSISSKSDGSGLLKYRYFHYLLVI